MKRKRKKEDAATRTARCFLLSEALAIANNSAGTAHIESIHLTHKASLKRFRMAMREAKHALATAALVSGDIGREARKIVKELTKAEANVSVGYVPMPARYERFNGAMTEIYREIADLRSRSARQCGVVRYDAPNAAPEKAVELLKKLETKARAELPMPPKGTWGYAPDPEGFRPIVAPPPKGAKK